MNLKIHIGTNKTGSSFLQSTLLINKELLQKKGVFLPESRWDEEMLVGRITPGNGHQLAVSLLGPDHLKLRAYLNKIFDKASNANCHTVLLSNEILVRLFADKHLLEILEKEANDAGFKRVHFLCFLRNFYEHALSLFKHRSKYGSFQDYDYWFETDYETLRVLKAAIETKNVSKSVWQFELYFKQSNKIINAVEGWLGLEFDSLKHYPKVVNASLTLNQISWFAKLDTNNHISKLDLYKGLMSIKSKSADNEYLVDCFYNAAEHYFQSQTERVNSVKTIVSQDVFDFLFNRPEIGTLNYSENADLLSSEEFSVIQKILRKGKLTYWFQNSMHNSKKFLASYFKRSQKKKQFDKEKFGGSLRQS
jgi:hypothetical protein